MWKYSVPRSPWKQFSSAASRKPPLQSHKTEEHYAITHSRKFIHMLGNVAHLFAKKMCVSFLNPSEWLSHVHVDQMSTSGIQWPAWTDWLEPGTTTEEQRVQDSACLSVNNEQFQKRHLTETHRFLFTCFRNHACADACALLWLNDCFVLFWGRHFQTYTTVQKNTCICLFFLIVLFTGGQEVSVKLTVCVAKDSPGPSRLREPLKSANIPPVLLRSPIPACLPHFSEIWNVLLWSFGPCCIKPEAASDTLGPNVHTQKEEGLFFKVKGTGHQSLQKI